MALTFPRDLVVELFLDGDWVDITTKVRQTNPITITRGRSDEQGSVAPSRLTMVLDNTGGLFTPRNPLSAYYGLLGRNTPIRVGLANVVSDTYTRSVTDGWGSTDTGEAWSIIGTAANFDVTGTAGTMSLTVAGNVEVSYLSGVSLRDCRVQVETTLAVNDITGGNIHMGHILLRGSGTDTYYRANFFMLNDERIGQQVNKSIAGVDTILEVGPALTGIIDAVSTKTITTVAEIEGRTIRMKVWKTGDPEPYDWTFVTTDNSSTAIMSAGWVGLRSSSQGTNTNTYPLVCTYDNFEVRIPRFAGEIANLKPRWDETHNIKTCELEAAGILRRLQQGTAPLASSWRRAMLTATGSTAAVAYWPCEEGKNETRFLPAIGDVPPIEMAVGKAKFAENDDFACSDLLPVLNGSLWAVDPSALSIGSLLHIRFLVSIPAGGDTPDDGVLMRLFTTGTAWIWDVTYNVASGGQLGLEVLDTAGGFILDQSTNVDMDGNPKLFTLTMEQVGANINVNWQAGDPPTDIETETFAGGPGYTGTLTSRTFGDLSLMSFGTIDGFQSTALGHISIHTAVPLILLVGEELSAFSGERSLDRFARVAEQEGVNYSTIGDPATSAKMGPQRVKTALEILTECKEVSRGTMFEARGISELSLRSIDVLYNQDPVATLSYADEQVSPPFEPSFDDFTVRNDITVKRSLGSEYHVQQTTGPLNVNNPGTDSNAVGKYDTSVEINLHSETGLADIANWELHVGTTDEIRYPTIQLNLRLPALTEALAASLLALDIDDRIEITGLSAADIHSDASLLVLGYTEVIDTEYGHTIALNCAPASPYDVMELDSSTSGKIDATDSALTTDYDDNDTSLSASFTEDRWTTDAAQFPIPVTIAGEDMTLTNVTGTTSPQTLTVTRNATGAKALPAGAAVHLTRPATIGLGF